jgi:hypothetical protein
MCASRCAILLADRMCRGIVTNIRLSTSPQGARALLSLLAALPAMAQLVTAVLHDG